MVAAASAAAAAADDDTAADAPVGDAAGAGAGAGAAAFAAPGLAAADAAVAGRAAENPDMQEQPETAWGSAWGSAWVTACDAPYDSAVAAWEGSCIPAEGSRGASGQDAGAEAGVGGMTVGCWGFGSLAEQACSWQEAEACQVIHHHTLDPSLACPPAGSISLECSFASCIHIWKHAHVNKPEVCC